MKGLWTGGEEALNDSGNTLTGDEEVIQSDG